MTVEIDGANNTVKTNTISEVTSANGVTVDGLSIKDSKLVTANSVVEANITNGAVTSSKIASGVIPSSRPNVNPIIINGDMQVAQRSTSVSTTGGGYKTVDRLQFNTASATGNATFTQENDAPSNTAFRKSMKISPNATETIDAGKNLLFTYAIEGQDVQVLQHGSASPPKATLSFWVKSSKTGAYCVQVKEETISNESYVLFEYTISQANTWEQKVFSWTGNSAHTLNNDNAMGMRLCFHLACGSDDHRSATTSWVDDSSYRATANQVNLFDNTSNNWYITGIQLEVGEYTSSTIPPFQHESFGDNLARCQRYYFDINPFNSQYTAISLSNYYTTSAIWGFARFPVSMRVAPTGDFVTGTSYFANNRSGAGDEFDSMTTGNLSPTQGELYGQGNASGTTGQSGRMRFNNTSARIRFTAEL